MNKGYNKTKVGKSIKAGFLGDAPDMKPTVSIDTFMLPSVKGWKVDKTYKVVLEVKMTGLHKRYNSDGLCGDFEILSAQEEEKE